MLTPGLYLVPTPIGNMEDITLRALRVLRECDRIFCEDTRRTGALLKGLQLGPKPLFSCHAHNENARAAEIVAAIAAGEAIAYASDAGMPGLSDPGARLIRACLEANAPYTVLPGPSAALTALILSGMPAEDACFVGFLPRAAAARRARLLALGKHPGTLILYESPLRVSDTCAELAAALGDRPAALCRELSKLYEECVRGSLSTLGARYASAPPKGECVLLVGGRTAAAEAAEAEEGARPEAMLRDLLARGRSARDAAKETAALTDMPRNRAYALALEFLSEGADAKE